MCTKRIEMRLWRPFFIRSRQTEYKKDEPPDFRRTIQPLSILVDIEIRATSVSPSAFPRGARKETVRPKFQVSSSSLARQRGLVHIYDVRLYCTAHLLYRIISGVFTTYFPEDVE